MPGLDPNDVERLALPADLDPAPLADGEMDHSAMPAEHPALEVDDLARRLRLRPYTLHQRRVIAVGNEADVLAVGLGRHLQGKLGGNASNLVLGQVPQRKANEV